MSKKYKLIICFLSLVCCITYNEINRYVVKKNNPLNELWNSKSVVHGGTIWSIDNFWYLTQAKNFLHGKGLVLDPVNVYTSVRRTPGYSIFYMAHLALIGEKYTHKIIPYSQAIIFALSALALALAIFNFTDNRLFALVSGIIYGCNPFTAGFVYYTITEAIHPAFVIFGFYFLSKALVENFNRNAIISGLFFAIACLIRPLNGLSLAAAVIVLLFTTSGRFIGRIKKVVVLGLGFSILVLPWTIRNYMVTDGDIVPLEKIYHEDPMYMGKKQTYLSKWWMCWGNPNPVAFVDSLKNEINTGREGYIARFVLELPDYAVQGYTMDELVGVLQLYKQCMQSEMATGTYARYHKPTDTLPRCEEVMKREFLNLIGQYRKDGPLRYYIISPLFIRGKECCLTSFSSMYGSLNPVNRDFSTGQRLIKGMMYLFNVGLYVSFLIFLFIPRIDIRLKSFVAFFVISTFLFVVYNVHVEGRYLLAAYPFMAVAAAIVLGKIILRLKSTNVFRSFYRTRPGRA